MCWYFYKTVRCLVQPQEDRIAQVPASVGVQMLNFEKDFKFLLSIGTMDIKMGLENSAEYFIFFMNLSQLIVRHLL